MKKALLILFAIFIANIYAQDKLPLELEDLYSKGTFAEHPVDNLQWQPLNDAFAYTKPNKQSGLTDIYLYNVNNDTDELLVKGDELSYKGEALEMSSFQWTSDGKYFLIAGPTEQIWRHSYQAPYYLFNVKTKEVVSLANNNPKLRNVKLSPDGKLVGYVSSHNLYVADLATGKETQITNDGSDNILNGEFDWVYEEEFGLADAWRWSADSKKIAFWKFDQTKVKEFNLVDEMYYYNKIIKLKYPKVGEQNAIINIAVADLESGKTVLMDLGDNDDIYVPRIYWTNSSSQLAMLRLNRQQNESDFLMADVESGKTKTFYSERNETSLEVPYYVNFLKQKDEIILTSEKSGYRHAYQFDYEGNLINQITSGDWEITELCGVDEANQVLYFYGKKESPIQQQIYKVNLDGSGLTKISTGHGWHTPKFSTDYKYFVDYHSSAVQPTSTILYDTDGEEVKVIDDGKIDALDKYDIRYPEFLTIKTSDGVELNGYIIKPKDFDPNKKYPVIVHGYGGPASQILIDKFSNHQRWFGQYMSQFDYVIFSVDNRGTGGRGKAFVDLSYGDLSKWSVNDQIEGARYLATLPYVDKDRIGFWGWSGGGYLTLALMTRATDYFKVGCAVAPVSDFKTYDAPWAERAMGLPALNEEGYERANIKTTAKDLEGKLLIIHGTGDDNVHYQNTLQFIEECILNNKQVDMFFYPNRNHALSGPNGSGKLNAYTKIRDYFDAWLKKN